MSHVFETRALGESLRKLNDAARVACIGDSMMYGFGGPRSHTFPAHLGRILNAAYPDNLVFVDNFAHTSGNVWHSWPLFKAHAGFMRFDAVVFSICQNDLELFDSNLAQYDQKKRMKTFDEGTPTWAGFSDMLREIKAWRDANAVDVLIMFYTFHPGDRPLIDRAAKGCEELGLPFLDALAFLTGETGISVTTYVVSEFDGHPSSLAHEMVARRVAREMRSRRFLEKAPATAKEGKKALVRTVHDMIGQGMQSDDAYSWVLEVADAKMLADRRAGSGGTSGSNQQTWQEAIDWAKAAMANWRTGLRRQVRSKAMEATCLEFEHYWANMAAHRRNVEEMVYYLTNASANTDYMAAYELITKGAHDKGTLQGSFGTDVVGAADYMRQRMDLLIARTGLTSFFPDKASLGREGDGPDRSAGLEDMLAYQVHMMDQQVREFEAYAKSIAGNAKEGEAFCNLLKILEISFKSYFVYGDRLSEQAEKVLSLSAPQGPSRTIINVAVEGAVNETVSDRLYNLVVHFIYDVPRRGVIRERQNAGATKERANYYFEFPLMAKGTVVVQVPSGSVNHHLFEQGKARITSIEVGNVDWNFKVPSEAKALRWKNDGNGRAFIRLDDVILS